MKFSNAVTTAILATMAAAAPTKTVNKRATECSEESMIETGSYLVYNNLWGEYDASSGSQCVIVNSLDDSTIAWDSTWAWTGGFDDVKSFANAVPASYTPTMISDISSMQSTFDWSYTATDLFADVAYDMYTSSSADGSDEYEIMIWLAAWGGAEPLSYSYGSDGLASPIASPTIGYYTFDLYEGTNDGMTVYSFVASEKTTSFSGDLAEFYDYLVDNEGFSNSQYLISVGAGTEAFTGIDAEFKVSAYSISIE